MWTIDTGPSQIISESVGEVLRRGSGELGPSLVHEDGRILAVSSR
jgi:hypothetical protein